MSELLKELNQAAKIRKQYRWAWGIYLLNTAVTILLIFVYPEDRALLRIYLFASIGPLLAQGFLFSQFPFSQKLKRFHPHEFFYALVTLGLILRGIFGERQDLYVYLLLGMGPILMASNAYTALRVREACDKTKLRS